MEPRDVYKLLYQGILGLKHLVASPGEFATRLRTEYEVVCSDDSGPLWEAVRPDWRLGRLNLRPFKARGGDVELEELRAAWATFVAVCQAGQWQVFALPEVLAFSVWLTDHGHPTVHHSARYREAYEPAYRLVDRKSLPYALNKKGHNLPDS
jgi:hypothetical protein